MSPSDCLWSAPEILKNQMPPEMKSKQGDVYGFAIIMQEIILEGGPFCANDPRPGDSEIVERILQGSYRPYLPPHLCPAEWKRIIESCWAENAEDRPTFSGIISLLKQMKIGVSASLVDNIILRLEEYTAVLENRVSEKTKELMNEKVKSEILLYELLPESIAEKLKSGKQIEPEGFESVTLLFSDIVGFTQISASASPMEVVTLLNNMYTVFDDVARRFDVYKVATIGDAYMLASGVPVRNQNRHASEICMFSLALLKSASSISIPHDPSNHLLLRIGIHSGPCVAGVTGIKMPRYLLFGETVDLASRMESSGEAMKIHVSADTVSLIKDESLFQFAERGHINLTNNVNNKTYWLNNDLCLNNACA